MSRIRGATNKTTMETWLKKYMKPGTVTVVVLEVANYKKSGVVKKIGLEIEKASTDVYEVWQWKRCEGSFKLISGTLANVHIFHLVPKKLKFVQPLGHSCSLKMGWGMGL